jgi:hypothetical protein
VSRKEQIKQRALEHLPTLINLVHPRRLLGGVHHELCEWQDRPDAKSHQLILLPRDHQKSAILAYRCFQAILRNPAVRILYLSSTANLATKQLKFIKDLLTDRVTRFYWPELVNEDEGKREKWTETEISVDHPLRKEWSVRDPTIFTGGLTTNITGLHSDIIAADDLVTDANAYTDEGRETVRRQYSYLASINTTGSKLWMTGTRYFPQDLYNDVLSARVQMYNDDGEMVTDDPLYEVFERQLEDRGDGTGQYIWPKSQGADGKWFGFDQSERAKKYAGYLDKAAFYAQYYNNPNMIESGGISREKFQYYDTSKLARREGQWFFNGRRLNVFAAVDFAYSLSKEADFTSIVVVGVDKDFNYYVLDIDRFKTKEPSEYFKHILLLHRKWDFRKLRAEVTAAQTVIVETLKQSYIKPHGLAISIDEYRPSRAQGTKEERIGGILQPRYDNQQIWHYQGGLTDILEQELVQLKPAHDDVKDALAACIDVAKAPSGVYEVKRPIMQLVHSRFGGIA